MNTTTLLRKIVLLAIFLFSLCSYAANVVNVPAAGQLPTILTQEQKDTITHLKITGVLDSNFDWYYGDYHTLRTMPNLKSLDLSEVSIAGNVIPSYAFYEKSSLQEVILPVTTETIGANAFYRCSSLSKITFPKNLATIGEQAFRECKLLAGELVLPESLTSIGRYSFYECRSITKITFPLSLRTIDYQAFSYCTSLSAIELKEGLQEIKYNAFEYCSSLTGEVVFPSTITSLGDNLFYSCANLNACKIKATTPPTIAANTFNHIVVIYVPLGAGDDYKAAANWTNKVIVDGDTPLTVSLNLTTAGTLGEEALKQVSHMSQIQKLIVSGSMNNADWLQVKTMTSLIEADFSAAESISIPNDIFNARTPLMSIKLPSNLETIGSNAFTSCYNLKNVELPESLLSIGISAFYDCNSLENIVLPSKINYIGESAFYSCDNLKEISIPNDVTVINNNTFMYCPKLEKVTFGKNIIQINYRAFRGCTSLKEAKFSTGLKVIGEQIFYDCTSLSSVTLPESLETINNYAFYNCVSLKEVDLPKLLGAVGTYAFQYCPLESITLPSTLMSLGYRAFETSQLKKVTCLQATPPILSNDPFINIDKSACELVVPYWAETSYKLADYWNLFLNVSTINFEVDYLPVKGSLVLSDNVRPLGNPSVEVFVSANLTVRGNAPFNTDNFTLRQNLNNYYVSNYLYSNLISESANVSAENVKIDMSVYGNRWYYFTFPFDVAVSDISIDENAFYVFRKYDGANRAINGAGSNWVTMSDSEVLRAGTGYIFQCNTNVNNLVLKGTETTKGNLFMADTWSTSLNTYATGNPADESWNLVGNPFPSFFDIHYLDYTAPMTVWNGSSYAAISPLDDNYILRPMEAFFVQKPKDLDAMAFNTEGRQITSQVRERSSAKYRSTNSLRRLINLSLSNQNSADKSRVVINSEAELAYEMTCDAAKFMSTDTSIPQLYSIDKDGVNYAINERPVANGVVELGYYAGEAGEYTIALDSEIKGIDVSLKDKLLDRNIDLKTTAYVYTTDAGTFNNRFELNVRINNSETGIGEDLISSVNVYAASKAMVVENVLGKQVTVYTLNGDRVMSMKLTDNKTTISVSQGIYIVKVEEEAFKVAVF